MRRAAVTVFLASLAAPALGCSSAEAPPAPSVPLEAVPPRVYVAKVKNLLLGLPATDAEVAAVQADPAALATLVDQWMQLPGYEQKLRRFFQLAFQQTQINANDFADQVFSQLGRNAATTPLLLQNVEESFARTMVELTRAGRPFTEAMTTRQLMMTTALKELYALLDDVQVDNDGHFSDHFRPSHRDTPIIVGAAQGPIPLAQTLDPQSPNYMHWYDPDIATEETIPECQQDPISLPPTALGLHFLLLGSIDGRRLTNNHFCPGFDGTPKGPQLTPADFADWTMVTVRPPAEGEPATAFYDLPALRRAKELVLSLPRLGFFTTPAFFANWQTNTSNQMRVTINQALIVATGADIDGEDPTAAPDPPRPRTSDQVHAGKAECATCHRQLDPARAVLAQTWSWNYHHQVDETWTGQPGIFAFRGVVQAVGSVAELGDVLAAHPLVAPGWTQKLCTYANSAPCAEDDPEFRRLVTRFRDSGYSFTTLWKELLLSPLTTFARPTDTARAAGEVVSVSRRDHLCAALASRLGLGDVCGLDALQPPRESLIPSIASGLPSDAYGRGATLPILPREPSLFFAAGLENVCKEIAATLIDGPADMPAAARRFSSGAPDAAIADFVALVMGLPPADPRAAPARELLSAHFTDALAAPGATATAALRSTFVVACQAPTATSVGL